MHLNEHAVRVGIGRGNGLAARKEVFSFRNHRVNLLF